MNLWGGEPADRQPAGGGGPVPELRAPFKHTHPVRPRASRAGGGPAQIGGSSSCQEVRSW